MDPQSELVQAIAGAAAGAASLAITYPLYTNTLRQQIRYDEHEHIHMSKNLIDKLKSMCNKQYIQALFPGLHAGNQKIKTYIVSFFYFF
jgi:hypothetical protein